MTNQMYDIFRIGDLKALKVLRQSFYIVSVHDVVLVEVFHGGFQVIGRMDVRAPVAKPTAAMTKSMTADPR